MIKLIELNNKYKSKKRTTNALDNINISFDSKGLCFILGSSGAGKTTLLNIISLQDKPTSGSLLIEDIDVTNLNRKQLAILKSNYFGVVFQNLNLIGDFSVYENIIMGLEIQKKTIEKDEVVNIIKQMNLKEDILNERISNLSGGQKQRVAIARALIKDSKVIICDEPTGSLDEDNSLEIMKILKDISKDRLVIVVSHNKELANEFGDRIITLVDGHINSDTNPLVENLNTKEMDLVKHTHLPFKFALKIAVSSFKKSVPKLIFTFVSIVITLAVFMFSLSIYSYNEEQTTLKAIESENMKYFDIIRPLEPSYFSENELEQIEKAYKDKYVLGHSSNDMNYAYSLNVASEDLNRGYFRNTVYLPEEMLEKFDFSLIGKLPTDEETFEIVLTKYDCYILGWVEIEQMNDEEIFQEIIDNKVFAVEFYRYFPNKVIIDFQITGILDTNFVVSDNEEFNSIQQEYEMHNNLFVTKETLDEIMTISQLDSGRNTKWYDDIYILVEDISYFEFDDLKSYYSEAGINISRKSRIELLMFRCNDMSSTYSKIFLGIAGFLLVISLFSYIGFIKRSIDVNKRKLKILRSLGITIIDSNNIFSIQALFISLICTILAGIIYLITINQVNEFLKIYLTTSMSLLNFSFIVVLLTFLVLFILSIFVTTLINLSTFKDKKLKFTEF